MFVHSSITVTSDKPKLNQQKHQPNFFESKELSNVTFSDDFHQIIIKNTSCSFSPNIYLKEIDLGLRSFS